MKDTIHPRVIKAAVEASEALTALGIRHVIVGGIAVAAHGYVRNTSDVDIMVGDEAFEHHGLLVAFKAGVPITANGVKVDIIAAEGYLEKALEPVYVEDLPIIPKQALIAMKLDCGRRKDRYDAAKLINTMSSKEVAKLAEYVEKSIPKNASRLVDAIEQAIEEE